MDQVAETFAAECAELQAALGCNLVVVFDGERPKLKIETSSKRRRCQSEVQRKARVLLNAGCLEDVKRMACEEAMNRVTSRTVEKAMEQCLHKGVKCMRAPKEVNCRDALLRTQLCGVCLYPLPGVLSHARHPPCALAPIEAARCSLNTSLIFQ